jgi:hypothetical protein
MKRSVVVLVGALLAVAATAVAVNARHESADSQNLRRAAAVAEQLAVPSGATASTRCHGDGLVACWIVTQPVPAVADTIVTSLRVPARATPTRTCDRVRVGTTGAPLASDSCFVRVRYGSRGVFVFLDPLVERDPAGRARVVGSQVSVSAS